jgi:hypothetical protein
LALLRQLPVRLNAEQVGWVLNCHVNDVTILTASKLLEPLGSPAPNSIKYFATAEILELSGDRTWLAKITNSIAQHWKTKNQRVPGHRQVGF